VGQHTLSDLPQHGWLLSLVAASTVLRARIVPAGRTSDKDRFDRSNKDQFRR